MTSPCSMLCGGTGEGEGPRVREPLPPAAAVRLWERGRNLKARAFALLFFAKSSTSVRDDEDASQRQSCIASSVSSAKYPFNAWKRRRERHRQPCSAMGGWQLTSRHQHLKVSSGDHLPKLRARPRYGPRPGAIALRGLIIARSGRVYPAGGDGRRRRAALSSLESSIAGTELRSLLMHRLETGDSHGQTGHSGLAALLARFCVVIYRCFWQQGTSAGQTCVSSVWLH